MQHQTIFALACSCLLHLAALLSVSATPKGSGTPNVLNTQPVTAFIYTASPNTTSQTLDGLTVQPAISQQNTNFAAAIGVTSALSPPVTHPTVPDASVGPKTPPITPPQTDQPQSLYGLEGKSNITYWPSDQVDQAALMLAEWPEGVSTSTWPSGQFVSLELWVNPDGALAEIVFSQKDLPDSLRITLVEIISHAGFKPAVKNGEPVGNHRILEMLLSQTSTPPLVKY